MDSPRKFLDEDLQGEALEAFTEKFLKAKFDRDRKRRWSKILEEEHGITPGGGKPNKRKARTIFLWLGTAAAAALLFLIYMTYLHPDKHSYQELADNYLEQSFFQNKEISKGDFDIEQLTLDATAAYNRKEFDRAIDNYEKIIALGAGESEHFFFLGISYLYNQNHLRAIEILSSLKEDEPAGIFQNETTWFLALAFLKNQEPEKAKPLLLEVKNSQWNNQEANQLLELLE